MAIPENWDIPQNLRKRIGKTIGRQRTVQADNHTIILIQQAPNANDKTRKGACCWIAPDGQMKFHPANENFDALFNGYRKKLDQLEADYKTADSAVKYFKILEEITPIHFAAIRMASALQSARELVSNNRQVLLWRDETFEIERESEILQNCAKNALDYYQAKSVEDLSKITYSLSITSHRLNQIATIFVPLMAIAGLFGMNIHNGLEDSTSLLPFIFVCILSLILGFALSFFFRTPKQKVNKNNTTSGTSNSNKKYTR